MAGLVVCVMEEFWGQCDWKALTEDSEKVQHRIYSILDLARRVQAGIENLIFDLAKVPLSYKLLYECTRFHYEKELINDWFIQGFRSEDGQEKKVKIINVDEEGRGRKSFTNGQAANFPESLRNEQYEVFFHGTNHRSAVNIIEEGIKLDKGEKAMDFSDGNGFYVSQNFEEAVSRARQKYSEGEAIVIFRVDSKGLRGDNGDNGLDLRNDRVKWLEVVREFRFTGCRPGEKPPNKKYRKQLQQYDFIEGPQAGAKRNPRHPTEQRGTHALCVRSARCAQLFNGSVHSVIFFER